MNVHISLKSNVFDVSSRLDEIQDIKEWVNELVLWDDSQYEMRFHSSGQKMIIWFEDDEHAILFKLRWGT